MFDKPEILNKIPQAFTGQKGALSRHGPAIWDALCDGLPGDGKTWWRKRDAIAIVQREFGFAKNTSYQYISAVINYVRAESGSDVIQRKGLLYLFT